MKTSTKIAAGVLTGALVAGALWEGASFEGGIDTPESAQITHEEITQDNPDVLISLGSLATTNEVSYSAQAKIGGSVAVPFTDYRIGAHYTWKDRYTGGFVGSFEFALKPAAEHVLTSRKDLSTPPKPDDTITVVIDRGALFENRPRLDLHPENKSDKYRVKDGMIVERGGAPVTPPERIFALDGNYTTPNSDISGNSSYRSNLLHNVTLGGVTVGKKAQLHTMWVGQLATQSPECVNAAWQVSSPDERAVVATEDEYVREGYQRKKVNVRLTGKWPKAAQLEDERGNTFADNQKALESKIPGDERFELKTTCETGNSFNSITRKIKSNKGIRSNPNIDKQPNNRQATGNHQHSGSTAGK